MPATDLLRRWHGGLILPAHQAPPRRLPAPDGPNVLGGLGQAEDRHVRVADRETLMYAVRELSLEFERCGKQPLLRVRHLSKGTAHYAMSRTVVAPSESRRTRRVIPLAPA